MAKARRRSNHDPRACRLLRRQRIKHPLLFEASRKFRRLVTDDAWWPAFKDRFPQLARMIEHETRATRSDLRESLALVVEASASRADLKSLRIGWRRRWHTKAGKLMDFVGLQRVTFSGWTGLAESTVSRAFTLLRRSGAIHGPGRDKVNVIAQPWEACDVSDATPRGRRGFPCIRRFHESFFVALGMGQWLADCREARKKKPVEKTAEPNGAEASRNIARFGGVVDELARALAPPLESG